VSAKYVAVEGCTVQVVAPAQGTVSITSQPSMKAKADGKGIYAGQLQISVSGLTQGSSGTATPGSATGAISPTASKTKAGTQLVLRVGDRVDGLVASDAQMPAGSSTAPSPITFSVEITEAGQTKMKGT